MGSGQSELGGFRIFKVNAGSPAHEAGLEVFFDFIIEVNGSKMEPNQKSFFEKIQAAENQKCKLVVYNIRSHTVRDMYVTPRQWGGVGLLGATVRYDSFENSDNQGIRVLEVFPNSPAAHAGLIPYKDYMLGTADVAFRDLDELVELVNLSLNKRMCVYIYNCDSETIREVFISPSNEWGGEGSIGCDIGTGLLHRIPAPRRPLAGATQIQPGMPPMPPQGPQGVPPPNTTTGPAPGGQLDVGQGYAQPQASYPPGYGVPTPQTAANGYPGGQYAPNMPQNAGQFPPQQPVAQQMPLQWQPGQGGTVPGQQNSAAPDLDAVAKQLSYPDVGQQQQPILPDMMNQTPQRSGSNGMVPQSPAGFEPPRVPPSTPMASTDGAQMMDPSVPVRSPGVMKIPEDEAATFPGPPVPNAMAQAGEGAGGSGAASGAGEQPPRPGVVYEAQERQEPNLI